MKSQKKVDRGVEVIDNWSAQKRVLIFELGEENKTRKMKGKMIEGDSMG